MNKRIIIAVVLGVVLATVIGVGVTFGVGNSDAILLKENQRYVYAYITSIQGNEVTYMEVEESVVTALLEEDTESSEVDVEAESGILSENTDFQDTETVDRMSDIGERGDFQGGEMPDMSNMPEMGEMPDVSSRPSEGESGQRGSGRQESEKQKIDERENSGESKMQFGGGTETVTTYIPVGVIVHTAADVSTTFSRLASGDLIKMLVESNDIEEDIIEEIWMLQ